MTIRVEVYTSGGMASGTLPGSVSLRDVLSTGDRIQLDGTSWQGLDETVPRQAGTLVLAIDDILFAVADEAPEVRIHAAWHHVLLDSGPYSLEGELATLPGFDPGRSLARPSGEFVLLREIRLSLQGRPEAGVSTGDHALVNRYAVEQIRADLELGFIFPGATVAPKPTAAGGLGAAQTVGGLA